MKKLFLFVFCFLFSLPIFAEEKINNLEVHFTLNNDASVTVKEYITFTSEHKKIIHGLYRQLSNDIGENINVADLLLDYKKCHYSIKNEKGFLKINFGTEDLLEYGTHTYIFTYTLKNVMRTNLFHDYLFWPINGGSWDLPIDKAKMVLTVPYAVKPITEKIIMSVGDKEENKYTTEQENIFVFETETSLKEREMFSIYFPVKKGVFYFKWYQIDYMPVYICILVVLYYIIIWYLIGRDPAKRNLPHSFTPPKNVSAGFASYFLNGKFSNKNLATVLSSLMIKKKIKITFPKLGKAELIKLNTSTTGLEEDEIRLFISFPYYFKFDKEGYIYLQKGLTVLNDYYEEKKNNFIINNFSYMVIPIIFLFSILFYFYLQGVVPEVLFGGVVNFLIPFLISIYTRDLVKILLMLFSVLILTMLGISSLFSPEVLADPNVIAVIITGCITVLFTHLINNLMFEGAVLRDELLAFKKYMDIAERWRVTLSNPTVASEIFCDYLPYAYAFGMESEWFDKFKNKIDFRIRDTYEPLITSTVFNLGLLLLISSCLRTGNPATVLPIPIGKGGLSGGGGL